MTAARHILTAGGIVVNAGNILLIQHKAGGLAFAKGHVEQDESPESAAIREVAEETPLWIEPANALGDMQFDEETDFLRQHLNELGT